MELSPSEQRICDVYSRQDPATGLYQCGKCPLKLDRRFAVCKANVTEEEYEDWREDEG